MATFGPKMTQILDFSICTSVKQTKDFHRRAKLKLFPAFLKKICNLGCNKNFKSDDKYDENETLCDVRERV